MPRQLPWNVGGGGGAKPAPRHRKTESASLPGTASPVSGTDRGGVRSFSKPRSGASTPLRGKSRTSLTARPDRSPSTSPPPEPISEDFMIEGLDHDDRYRMVEDEFLSMANDFTKHLHAAEYHRLKALASTRNAAMIRTISRPVTGGMTDLVKRRRGALGLAASQRKGIRDALGKHKGRDDSGSDEDEDDDDDIDLPWAGTSLQGLMESPRKVAVPLPAGSSNLGHEDKAATTLSARRHTDSSISAFASRVGREHSRTRVNTASDEDDDDDLDTQPRYRRQTIKAEPVESNTLSLNQKAASIEAMAKRREPTLPPKSAPRVTVEESLVTMSARQPAHTTDTPDDDEEDDFMAQIRRRREHQRRRREAPSTGDDKKKRGSSAVDAIPLF